MTLSISIWVLALIALFLISITFLITRALVAQIAKTRSEAALAEQRLRLESQVVELTARLSEEERRLHDFKQEDQARTKTLEKEFERLANKIFDEKQERFAKESRDSIDTTLKPLREQVDGFRKRVEEVHSADIADRNRLKGQIEELQKQASQIGTDAVSLANALKGDSKVQGNWGEVALERLLEQSGLIKGSEYKTQEAFTDEQGKRYLPDVVVHLPEGRAMVIDSKVSLTHYQAYVNEPDEGKKSELLKLHINSLRNHYKSLHEKAYQDLAGIDSLDFVFMFVPVEPAFLLALRESPTLFEEAFDKRVTLVSHTTLMPMLKTVQSLWRKEKQNRNANEIAESAGNLHDAFVRMLTDMEEIGASLDKATKAYESTRNRITEGRGNLIGRVDKLTKLGAKAKKEMPASVRKQLTDDSE